MPCELLVMRAALSLERLCGACMQMHAPGPRERAVERLAHEAMPEDVRPLDLLDEMGMKRLLERLQRRGHRDSGDDGRDVERETLAHRRCRDEERLGIGP